MAFDYFHLQELEKVQNAHPTLGNGLTQYFAEMRVWELYCKFVLRFLIFEGAV